MKILLVAINSKYIHSNLAVYSLKAYAQRQEVDVSEFTINNLIDEILDEIYLKKPDILAFSCYIWNIEYVRKIICEIKKLLPEVKIWAGGPEAFYNSKSLLRSCADIDIIIKGEGEVTFKRLCDFYLDNNYQVNLEEEFLGNLSGIDFRTKNGVIVENPCREPMNMSEIPFPYPDLAAFNNKIIYYESSRGCPFSCSYCLSSVEKRLRFRDIELVKQELKLFMDNKIPQVKFVDRTFNCNKTHAMEIWKFIFENDNGITNFHFEIAADLIDEEELELISKMRPGLIQLEIGVQSVNPMTIKEIRRTMKLDKLRYVVNKINSFKNIHQHLDLIAGLPYEDLNSFINSFNEVYAMKPKELQLGFLKVLAGSYMYENKDNYGLVYKDYQPYEVISTNWISYDEILLLKGVEEMVEVYYNSGQFVFALNMLENYFETPFKLFYELSKYYEAHFDKASKHSRISRYMIILEFIKEYMKKTDVINKLKLFLTFDIYLRENAKSRPDFAKDNSVYREDIKNFAKEQGIKKEEHIEVLTKEEMEWLDLSLFSDINKMYKQVEDESMYYFVFDYENKNPITNQCRVKLYLK